jgi:hypothetical protein
MIRNNTMKSILPALLLCTTLLSAQQPAPDTSSWRHSIVTSLAASEVSYTDWAQGGENALSWTGTLDGKSTSETAGYAWANTYNFAYGTTKLGSQGVRKTDDKIDIASTYVLKIDGLINPYVAATLKTQFAKGLSYAPDGTNTEISAFFDPAFITQSAGLSCQPMPALKTRLGAALREVVTSMHNQYADGKKTKTDGGVESVTEADLPLMENVILKAKLELFAPIRQFDQVIVRSDNTIAAKVNKYISANFNIQLIQERTISPRTQIKQTIALGFSYVLQ